MIRVNSFSIFDKIKKYYEVDNVKKAKNSYSIEVGERKQTINSYVVVSAKYEIAC